MDDPWKVHASSLNIGYICPGAPWLWRQLPPRPPNDESPLTWGTLAHEWVALAVLFEPRVSYEWMMDGGEELADFNREMADTWGWITDEVIGLEELRLGHIERRYRLDLPEVNAYISGRLDWCAPGRVIDWKWGPGARYYLPPIETDLQMTAYASCVAAGWPEAAGVVVERVRLSNREVDRLELSDGDIQRDRELLAAVVEDIVEGRDHRIPGTHCDHCLARGMCPERLELAEQALSLVPGEPRLLALTDEQATRYALSRRALRERLDELDAALERHIEAGGVVEHDGKRMALSRFQVDRVVDHGSILGDLAVLVGGPAHLAMRTSKDAVAAALAAVKKKGELPKLLRKWREAGWVVKEPRQALRWRKKRPTSGTV